MEAAMKDNLASASRQATQPGTLAEPAKISFQHYSLATLQIVIANWEERIRFRWTLRQMSKDNPHLIDDIGLTKEQVEAEIAKPFWQA